MQRSSLFRTSLATLCLGGLLVVGTVGCSSKAGGGGTTKPSVGDGKDTGGDTETGDTGDTGDTDGAEGDGGPVDASPDGDGTQGGADGGEDATDAEEQTDGGGTDGDQTDTDPDGPDDTQDAGEDIPCCLASGCTMLPLQKCRNKGGQRHEQQFDSCSQASICPTKKVACCTGQDSCSVEPLAACNRKGGRAKQRNLTSPSCSPNPCKTTQKFACCTGSGCAMKKDASSCSGTFAPGLVCSQNPCQGPKGACCGGTGGQCENLTRPVCTQSRQGNWVSGQTCSDSPCQSTTACCRQGSCTMETQTSCMNNNGTPKPGQTCNQNPCTTKTACCQQGSCTMKTQSNCTAAGGVSQPGTQCSSNPCPDKTACCDGGSCSMKFPINCTNGVVKSNKTCSADPCKTISPCCGLQPSCIEIAESVCKTNGGKVQSASSCTQNLCGTTKKKGVCCVSMAGRWQCLSQGMDKQTCNSFPATSNWKPGKTCSQVTCGGQGTGPKGACCELSFQTRSVTCTRKHQSKCTGGFKANTQCSAVTCDSQAMGGQTGACCGGGMCIDVRENYCPQQGNFKAGAKCSNSPCGATTGACCVSGNCQNISKSTCQSFNGTFYKNQMCSNVNCP